MADFHNTKSLPSKGIAGDVYRVSTTGDMYLAVGDGTLILLKDLLSTRDRVVAVGPAGETGRQGEPGRNGRDGVDGRNGKDGADGMAGSKGERGPQGAQGIPGKNGTNGVDGKSIVGPQGPKGDKGDPGEVLYVGPAELEAAVKQLREEKARVRAALLSNILGSEVIHPTVRQLLKSHLERVQREAGLL